MAIKKPVSFSEDERELKLLKFANSKFSFSAYVKELIEKDMEASKKDNSREKKRGVELDF